MTYQLFLASFSDDITPGTQVVVDGDEGHHAVAVKRIAVDEYVLLANGCGTGVIAQVQHTARGEFQAEVREVLKPGSPGLQWTVVQALAKADRGELAVQMATEVGAAKVLAWQAARSIVKWQGDRGDKALRKWQATAREATKQSRRFSIPDVEYATTNAVVAAIQAADVALVLHEDAIAHIAEVKLPTAGTGLIIVGPEGGITADELSRFLDAGAQSISISDGVLRTSTAAAVALGQLDVVARRP